MDPIEHRKTHAVLTGDLIHSGGLDVGGLARARDVIRQAVKEFSQWLPEARITGPEFFRGDSWQLLLASPAHALRAALLVRAALIAAETADSRISIGFGPVKEVLAQNVSASSGLAFEISGRGLDSLPANLSMTMAAAATESSLPNAWLPAIAALCDALVKSWSPRQAEIVRLALHPQRPTHANIGSRLRPAITQQAVSKSLERAAFPAIALALAGLERMRSENALQQSPFPQSPEIVF